MKPPESYKPIKNPDRKLIGTPMMSGQTPMYYNIPQEE